MSRVSNHRATIRKSMPSDLIRGWVPVFPRDKREAFARRSCSDKKIERHDDSKVRAVTTDHFSSRAPDASRTSAASLGPFYFAWGCFRDFVSGLRGVPPIACRRRA